MKTAYEFLVQVAPKATVGHMVRVMSDLHGPEIAHAELDSFIMTATDEMILAVNGFGKATVKYINQAYELFCEDQAIMAELAEQSAKDAEVGNVCISTPAEIAKVEITGKFHPVFDAEVEIPANTTPVEVIEVTTESEIVGESHPLPAPICPTPMLKDVYHGALMYRIVDGKREWYTGMDWVTDTSLAMIFNTQAQVISAVETFQVSTIEYRVYFLAVRFNCQGLVSHKAKYFLHADPIAFNLKGKTGFAARKEHSPLWGTVEKV